VREVDVLHVERSILVREDNISVASVLLAVTCIRCGVRLRAGGGGCVGWHSAWYASGAVFD
jgi:hypothetical protein